MDLRSSSEEPSSRALVQLPSVLENQYPDQVLYTPIAPTEAIRINQKA